MLSGVVRCDEELRSVTSYSAVMHICAEKSTVYFELLKTFVKQLQLRRKSLNLSHQYRKVTIVSFRVLLSLYTEPITSTSRCSRTTYQDPCDMGALREPHNEHSVQRDAELEYAVTLTAQAAQGSFRRPRAGAPRASERAPRAGSCAPSSCSCPTPHRAVRHGPPHASKSFVRMSSANKQTTTTTKQPWAGS